MLQLLSTVELIEAVDPRLEHTLIWLIPGAAKSINKMYLHSAELNVVAVTENVNTFLLV